MIIMYCIPDYVCPIQTFHSLLTYNRLKLKALARTLLIIIRCQELTGVSLIWTQNDNILLNTLNLLDLFTFKSSGLSVDVKENSASSICLFDKFMVERFGTSAKLSMLPELMKTEMT